MNGPPPAPVGAPAAAQLAVRAAEAAARGSYGRLVAMLASRSGDIALAEDALADAFAAALERWPQDGVPHVPDAWLLTVARRRIWDAHRHRRVQEAGATELAILDGSFDTPGGEGPAAPDADTASPIPDQRLALLFACAHPAIDRAVRPALMLQTVLGLPVARMAPAFRSTAPALGQRLVRAKARIRAAGIPFEHPRSHELAARLADVLEAVYAAFGAGWDAGGWQAQPGADATDTARGLDQEAIELGRILVLLAPREPEPAGLLALMLFCQARTAARRDAQGAYVPLAEQDTARWDADGLAEAERLLLATVRLGAPGPYQLEAAIQSAHSQRRLGHAVPPAALLALYDGLVACAPHLGAQIGRACALADAQGPAAGLAALDALDASRVAGHQPYWAARAELLRRLGDAAAADAAHAAYRRAIGLASDPAVRDWLCAQQARLDRSHRLA